MYNLIIKHNGQIIIHRVLTPDELSTLQGPGLQLVINAFIKYLGLDIRSYGLNEFEQNDDSFTVYIRNEDLEKLRDNKLNKLGL
jgi:hypothetical protein